MSVRALAAGAGGACGREVHSRAGTTLGGRSMPQNMKAIFRNSESVRSPATPKTIEPLW